MLTMSEQNTKQATRQATVQVQKQATIQTNKPVEPERKNHEPKPTVVKEKSTKGYIVKGIDISGLIRIGILLTVIVSLLSLFFQTYWTFTITSLIGTTTTIPGHTEFYLEDAKLLMILIYIAYAGLNGYLIVVGALFLSNRRIKYSVYYPLSIVFMLVMVVLEILTIHMHANEYVFGSDNVNPLYMNGLEDYKILLPLMITTVFTTLVIMAGPIILKTGVNKARKMSLAYIKRKAKQLRDDLTTEQKMLLIENFVPRLNQQEATIELGLKTMAEFSKTEEINLDKTIMLG